MDDSRLVQYLNNNNKISLLLAENEKILKDEGYQPPCDNFSVDKRERINLPSGYIRRSDEFGNKYHLADIVETQNVRKNISYALQLSDYYNFLINRFNVWGSIETMLYKQAFVNIVSIIESLILESSHRINCFCKRCQYIGKCGNNINRENRSTMKSAATKLLELGVLELSEDEYKRLIDLYDLRNKIHIILNEQNEFLDNKYNMSLYNEAICLLQKVDELLLKNAVPLYKSCIGYKNNKER